VSAGKQPLNACNDAFIASNERLTDVDVFSRPKDIPGRFSPPPRRRVFYWRRRRMLFCMNCVARCPGQPKRPAARADACYADLTVVTRTFTFPGDREMIRDRAAKLALAMLRFHLLGRLMVL